MRYTGLALLFSAVVLNACGGEQKPATESAGSTAAPVANAIPITPLPAQPIAGATVEVKMVLNGTADYRFEPADVTVKAGDGIKFVTVSGQPHNIEFLSAGVSDSVKAQLAGNMPERIGDLLSKVLLSAGETYTVSFAGIKPGKYEFDCPLHRPQGMKGSVTVQ